MWQRICCCWIAHTYYVQIINVKAYNLDRKMVRACVGWQDIRRATKNDDKYNQNPILRFLHKSIRNRKLYRLSQQLHFIQHGIRRQSTIECGNRMRGLVSHWDESQILNTREKWERDMSGDTQPSFLSLLSQGRSLPPSSPHFVKCRVMFTNLSTLICCQVI